MKQLFSVIIFIVLSAFAAGADLAAPLLTDLEVEYTYDRTGNTVLEQASYYPYGISMSESFQMDRENHKIGNRIDEAEALKNFNK